MSWTSVKYCYNMTKYIPFKPRNCIQFYLPGDIKLITYFSSISLEHGYAVMTWIMIFQLFDLLFGLFRFNNVLLDKFM